MSGPLVILFADTNMFKRVCGYPGELEGMNCPKCAKEMESGFVRAESFIGGVKWMKEKSNRSLGLEGIAKPDSLGFCFMQGYRCPECRYVIIQY